MVKCKNRLHFSKEAQIRNQFFACHLYRVQTVPSLPVVDETRLPRSFSLLLFISFADFLFKFLVIGSAGTGKSCILHQFIEGKCKLKALITLYVKRQEDFSNL